MTSDNLFSNLPAKLPSELFVTLLKSANVRIEKIVSHGHSSADGFWYAKMSTNGLLCCKGWLDLPSKTSAWN